MDYTESFFDDLKAGSKQSATQIVPLILELLKPSSVVDIGCGSGEWLSVFDRHGVEDILGVDGNYVDRNSLAISSDKFLPLDLTQPFTINRKFDLVVSLEVAEHLPVESAENFIDSLTKLGSVVLFSAAIPFQGGTHHVNEQWQTYWIELFSNKNYQVIDCVRPLVWQNPNVEYWYAQNTFVFVRQDYLEQHKNLKNNWEKSDKNRYSLVHPRMYLELHKTTIQEYEAAITRYEAVIEEREAVIEERDAAIAKYEAAITRYDSAVTRYETVIEEREAVIEERDAAIDRQKTAIDSYSSSIEQLEKAAEPKNMSFKKLLLALPIVSINFVKRKLNLTT